MDYSNALGRCVRLVLVALLLTFSAIELGSQPVGAKVVIASVPAWGQSGNLTGSVYGVSSSEVRLYAFEFIPDEGWYQLGGCSSIPIQSTGEFSVDATPEIMGRYATRFSAYLLPPTHESLAFKRPRRSRSSFKPTP
jgi:hypothetical protein